MTTQPLPASNLTEAALSKRSSLYVWMLKNHDEFASVVALAGRPNWQALAEKFGQQGYRDSDNHPPTAEATRQTWWKVRKTVKARRAKQGAFEPTRLAPPTADPPSLPQPPSAKPIPEPTEQSVSPDDDGYKEIQALGADGKLTTVRVRKR